MNQIKRWGVLDVFSWYRDTRVWYEMKHWAVVGLMLLVVWISFEDTSTRWERFFFFFQGPSTYRRRCFSQRVFCVLLSCWRTVGLHRWQNNQDLRDGPHISPSLSITACIHPDNHLRIHNWEAYGDKAPLSSDLGIYLPLPMHSTTWSVCWELHLGRDGGGGGGGGAFSQLPGSQYVWVHFFPLHGKWMWGPEGPDISGAWPGSSCLYLAVYCDAPVMRTGIGPLRRPVGNLYSHLHLPLCYRMDNSLN